ncbi:MAG: T9SS type A sorting domain-containing protein, partial [Bacteroidota bacterium]|nr:T9SS type A sorting domain-containing protein [Bacteroidota bacterium]
GQLADRQSVSSTGSEKEILPTEFVLYQNYPNPFNPATTIKYTLPKAGHTSLIIYNILGEKVVTLFDGFQYNGNYEVAFSGRNLAGGVYFYELISGNTKICKKMVLLN